jgi:hypothetical protein
LNQCGFAVIIHQTIAQAIQEQEVVKKIDTLPLETSLRQLRQGQNAQHLAREPDSINEPACIHVIINMDFFCNQGLELLISESFNNG